MTSRYNAQWQVRDIMQDEYSWFVFDVRCGSVSWSFGIHFPCTFTHFGSRYIVCYHSLAYDYGIITPYNALTCHKWY